MRDIIEKILREYTENLNEGSKRVKIHPRTQSDLEYMSDILYKS